MIYFSWAFGSGSNQCFCLFVVCLDVVGFLFIDYKENGEKLEADICCYAQEANI